MAEVEHVLGADKAFGQQGTGVVLIALLFIHRHQPPQRRAPAEPDGGAVELIQQQVMLGGAAVVRGQLRLAFALGETRGINQEEMRFGAEGGRPAFQ